MASQEGNLEHRLHTLKGKLNDAKKQLDKTVTDPESDERDIHTLMVRIEAIAAEINSLEEKREAATLRILEALKESKVIEDYVRVKDVVQIRIGSEEMALKYDQLLIFLSGLIRGGKRAHETGADLSTLRIEDYLSSD